MSDGDGTRIASFVRDRPVLTYAVLTITLSWSVWIPTQAQTGLSVTAGSFGPAVAAATVTRLRGDSVRRWLRTVVDPRAGLRWYAAGLALPLVWAAAMLAGMAALTGSIDTTALRQMAPALAVNFPLITLIGGGNEEFGWRGFALPTLQERTGALTASVVVGVVWAGWHLPLFVFGYGSYGPLSAVPGYVANVVGVSVVLTWLYNESGPSILPVMAMHGMFNTVMGPATSVGGVSAALPRYLLQAAPIWVTAVVAIVAYGRNRLADSLVDATTLSTTAE